MTTDRNSSGDRRQPTRGGRHTQWCAVVMCMAWCGAQREARPEVRVCGGTNRVTPGGTAITEESKLEFTGANEYQLLCIESLNTGCGAEPADVYVETHDGTTDDLIESTLVSTVLASSVFEIHVHVPAGAYVVHRHHRRSDNTTCADDGTVRIKGSQVTFAAGSMKILTIDPPVAVAGQTVTVTMQAPSEQNIEVFDTISCPAPGDTGTVVETITSGKTGKYQLTIPSDLSAGSSHQICARVRGTTQTLNTSNSFIPFNMSRVYYKPDDSWVGLKRGITLYFPNSLAGHTLLERGNRYYCRDLVSSTPSIGTITEEQVGGKTIATAEVPSTTLIRDGRLCVKGGNVIGLARVVTLQRAAFQSYVECGYDNSCWVAAHPELSVPSSASGASGASDTSDSSKSHGISALGIIVAAVVLLVCVLTFVFVCVWCLRTKKAAKLRMGHFETNGEQPMDDLMVPFQPISGQPAAEMNDNELL